MKKIKEDSQARQNIYNILRKPILTATESRLYYAALATVTEEDTIETEFKVNVQDIAKIFNLDIEGLYKEIKKSAYALKRKSFEKFEYDAKGREVGFEAESLFYKAKYRTGDAAASVWLGPSSLEYAKKKEGDGYFSAIVLKNIANLSSGHSIRFYELMNSWKGLPKRTMPLTAFKELMGLPHRYNGNNTGFINYIVKPCQDEINRKTNLNVRYILTGAGKKRGIDFRITIKKEVAPDVKSDGAPEKVKKWSRLGIVRGQTEYYTLMNLVKEDTPASYYGDKPGAYKAKEKYLDYYLGQAEWMLEQDPLLAREEAIIILKKMLKEDSDQKTFYKYMELRNFDEKIERQAHERACRQIAARDAGIEQHKVKKLEKENGESERAQM